MAGIKEQTSFSVQADLVAMLDEAATRYDLPSRDKALRCMLDYVATEGDWDEIFTKIRCLRCGRRPGWTPAE